MAPRMLPLVVAAIAVPTALAFIFGGPGAGLAVGAVAAVGLIVFAVRQRPLPGLGVLPGAGVRPRLLVAVACPVEDPDTIATIAAEAAAMGEGTPVMVLAPVRIGFLDRWASDLESARAEAQRNLVLTVAALTKAGVRAEARVGDEDLVQAVEDATQSFAATEVILVAAAGDPALEAAAPELEARLRARFRRLALSDPKAR